MSIALDIPRWEADQQKARQVADLFAARTRAHFGNRIQRLKLFGSTVRGEWMPESDVDILITLDRISDEDRDWIVATSFSVGLLDNEVLIQPVILVEEEFQRLLRQERLFAREVEKAGVTL